MFSARGAAGLNVSTVLLTDSATLPSALTPSGPASLTFDTLAPASEAGSTGSENVTTMGSVSDTPVARSAGVTLVIAGGCAVRRIDTGRTARATMKPGAAPVSFFARSAAVNVTLPLRAAAA